MCHRKNYIIAIHENSLNLFEENENYFIKLGSMQDVICLYFGKSAFNMKIHLSLISDMEKRKMASEV